jgi:hypothetical protein
MWAGSSINARLPQMVIGKKGKKEITISPALWLDKNRPVEQVTWAPGLPQVVKDHLMSDGGWIERKGVSCFNLYRPPTIKPGDAAKATPWVDLVRKIYLNDAGHIIRYFAHRVQKPDEKINHGLMLGSKHHGIGKDTIIEGVRRAIGAWNFQDISPKNMFGDFNPFVRCVILRVNEAKDMGDVSRYELRAYETVPCSTAGDAAV